MMSVIALVALLTAHNPSTWSQDSYRQQGDELLRQARYGEAEEVFARWVRAQPNDPDAHYQLALSRALQGRWADAREGFLHVLTLDPRRSDAYFEIAATFIKGGDYVEAAAWSRRGLKLAPADEYGLDLAGTSYYLAGFKEEALRYWNKSDRPHLTETRIITDGSVARQTIADEIGLGPGDLLSWREIQKARWRLSQHRYFRSVVFDPVPGATPDEYSLDVTASARHGVGNPWELLFNTVSEINFRTVDFDYWNIGGSSLTLSVKWRWVSTAQWLQAEISIPRLLHLPLYSAVTFDDHDDAWELSPGGVDFHLHTRDLTVRSAIPIRLPRFSATVSVVGRQRMLTADAGAALTTGLGPLAWNPGQADRATRVMWVQVMPQFVSRTHRLTGAWSVGTAVRADVDGGWANRPAGTALFRFSLSPEIRAERGSGRLRKQVLAAGVHAGTLSTGAPVEDYFVLAVGPGADFPLRAHPLLFHGHPGSAPLARRFVLGNLTGTTDVCTWGWLKIGVRGFADAAWIPQGYAAQRPLRRLVDAGVGIELGSTLFGSGLVTATWGRDWYGHRNVFYVGTALR